MVHVTLDKQHHQILLDGLILTYGQASDDAITRNMAAEIETLWNEPRVMIPLGGIRYNVQFRIGGRWTPDLSPEQVVANTDPRLNFYRIEEFAYGNISFVDGIGSNTGYFKRENLYPGSTTAAHEFGHGLGLDHPERLDIRGEGRPGIMYPRGTWVDPEFQYDAQALPGDPGGTMHPMHRRVRASDLLNLQIPKLRFSGVTAILGDFTNQFHPDHHSLMQ